ncbi:endolytic transglycosylase MltG [Clostridium sp. DL1XJH146]
MKKVVIIIMTLFFVLGCGAAFIFYKINDVIENPLTIKEDTITINVEKGMTFYTLLESLDDENKIQNPLLIKLAIKYTEIDAEIKAGEYEINRDVNLQELIENLSVGNLAEGSIKVTIPEGYTVEDIARALEEQNVISKEEFLSFCSEYKNPIIEMDNDEVKYEVEGFLFPDTYMFKENSSSEMIASKMIDRYEEVMDEIVKNQEYSNEEIYKYITIASMIEEEAKVDEERSLVSSVIYNRVDIGMPLQLDATVIYALGEHKDGILIKDTKTESSYNTYYIKGLPVGPITNPGKASIEAAINPADTDYIYYVYDNEGKHYFTDNYNDFLEAKQRYKENK